MTEEYGIKARAEHYNRMVDLLGRPGFLEEAESLIENADCRSDSSIWAVLLGASCYCRAHCEKNGGIETRVLLDLILLANVYKAVGRWKDAQYIRSLMALRGVKKAHGKSWIETKRILESHLDV
ncbi:hypothetical protein CFOL_v3_35581 [Cephalotus follicularis]|uniref:PPR domain-containing protein n=1 Tax=Cephalotus follicularis TaxID=3775 RepID=A0A1Q3DI64_CEPFO|nr:hypothetical protein CFOL_v3_35581 [Cephalotus follicularis]